MKKTFFYNFIPSKAEEEACKASNTPWVVTRQLIEIRDIYPPPVLDLKNPWQIKKTVTYDEAVVGKLVLPFIDVFEYIFRYWTLDMANLVVSGHKVNVSLWDVTEENNPKKYDNYFEMLPNDDYALVCLDLYKDRGLSVDDEIGLYWDPRSSTFVFKEIF
ncbi:B3 domain-containing protein At5g26805-like [Nicotiana tabacum]|uniref:B3 domain-containing protein At5g26805-like n=1 Tax=Nicotiana tabacum TaxID=4097 RepID=A0AC58TWM6_TOBAC